jgi:ADP-heptose:LPS heptosyltransferase
MLSRSLRTDILIIKLGALGDFIQSLGPMKAIREHHPAAQITLLTTLPYEKLAHQSGYVDTIWIDDRPRIYQFVKWLNLRNRLRLGKFSRVYDLQTSGRSASYFKLFSNTEKPEWSGIAKGCSHHHSNPSRNFMHTQDRQREQLQIAGIYQVPPTDLSWMTSDLSHFNLPQSYGLLVPGGAAHRPAKRWPTKRYTELAAHMNAKGITPIILGTSAESDVATKIVKFVPETLDFTGKTNLIDIGAMAKKAKLVVGNDTGPMHIASATNCPCIVLFSNESDPKLCAPKGKKTTIIARKSLVDLNTNDVLMSLTFEQRPKR